MDIRGDFLSTGTLVASGSKKLPR